MSEDKRAHERIDGLEKVLQVHIEEHFKFEQSLAENIKITREIADNTSEMVALFKGVKGLRSLIVWGAPVAAVVFAVIAYLRDWR